MFCDNSVNTAGRKLIKLCNNHSLRVANGQTPGDRVGNYTCFNNGGVSVVDYLMTEIPLHKNILDFKVVPTEFDSKHAPITTTFKISELRTEKRKLFNLPKAYKWNSQRGEIFQSLLNDKETKRRLEVLCDRLKEKNKPGNILTTCADKSLTLKRKKNTHKRHSKPWYNNSCSSQRKQLTTLAYLLQKNPKNPYLVSQYQKVKKSYNHTIKINKRKWEIDHIKRLESLVDNPRQFWSHLKSLRGIEKSGTLNAISPNKWFKHFSKIFESKNIEGKNPEPMPNLDFINDNQRVLIS